MKRPSFFRRGTLALLLLLLCQGGYYLYTFNQQQYMIEQQAQKGRKLLLDIPLLPTYQKQKGPISSEVLWNMATTATTAAPISAQTTGEAQPAVRRYGVKLFGGIQALYQLQKQQNRWELYGVIRKKDVTQAVFYNPSLRDEGWRVIKAGGTLTDGLVVTAIVGKKVEVKAVSTPDEPTWSLAVFDLPPAQP